MQKLTILYSVALCCLVVAKTVIAEEEEEEETIVLDDEPRTTTAWRPATTRYQDDYKSGSSDKRKSNTEMNPFALIMPLIQGFMGMLVG